MRTSAGARPDLARGASSMSSSTASLSDNGMLLTLLKMVAALVVEDWLTLEAGCIHQLWIHPRAR